LECEAVASEPKLHEVEGGQSCPSIAGELGFRASCAQVFEGECHDQGANAALAGRFRGAVAADDLHQVIEPTLTFVPGVFMAVWQVGAWRIAAGKCRLK